MNIRVKQEIFDAARAAVQSSANGAVFGGLTAVIELSSSSSDSESDNDDVVSKTDRVSGIGRSKKRRKLEELGVVLPVGFLAPLSTEVLVAQPLATGNGNINLSGQSCKQFWKAGDYEGAPSSNWNLHSGSMDHFRVHPKFLHSNATSHKWALGAFAELLDNSLDEFCNGATYVNIDMLLSRKDATRMLLIEDNGGGMDPDKMRQCMSLGYSAKNKVANTIGQYGNGFKTSTMRLGADVVVFSRCCGKDGKSPTQSIGLLSYTFLRSTGKEDIVVPMLDYEREGREWNKMIRFSANDWNRNVETIIQWSPYSSEADLLRQFNMMSDHGTRIIIYNLWEDDQGLLELDFDADPHDIQLGGVNRDEKHIQMAKEFPNSRHFLTYRHSLRSYASILYLRLPPSFRIILRGKDVEHHNIANDMMLSQEITYKPQPGADGVLKDTNMTAVVTIGFVKDAKHHIDVQGFNVYHKNRLIKPFWRLWNAAGSDGRGVIGVLEANFVEPAHDKQGFERTTVLARLESRLVQMQKNYWSTYCHKIGYAPRRNKKTINESEDREIEADYDPHASQSKRKYTALSSNISPSCSNIDHGNGHIYSKGYKSTKSPTKSGKNTTFSEPSPPSPEDVGDDYMHNSLPARQANGSSHNTKKSIEKNKVHATRSSSNLEDTESQQDCISGGETGRPVTRSQSKVVDAGKSDFTFSRSDLHTINHLKRENCRLKERLEQLGETQGQLVSVSQCEKCKSLEIQLQETQQKVEELNKEQETLIDIFSEERDRRDKEEETLRKKLKDASNTIQELLDKVRLLEKMKR